MDLLRPGWQLMNIGIPATDRISFPVDHMRRKELDIRNVRRQQGCAHDAVALIGPADRIKERLAPWKEAGKRGEVGSMLVGAQDPAVLELLAEEML